MKLKTKLPAPKFVKPTISLPAELSPWVRRRKAEPQHAGNLSSYIRSLILEDRAKGRKATS